MDHDAENTTTVHARRAAAGDQGSASWLVERLSPLLVAQAAWRLGPNLRRHCDPEDLVADAWLRLLPRIESLPPRDGRYTPVLFKFLSTAILNRVNLLIRKHLKRGRETVAEDALVGMTDEMTGVVSRAVRRETASSVATALAELPPQDQEIVLLRGIEQRENTTVAELLGLTPAASAMRYHRALKRLRGRLPGSIFDELLD